MEADAVGDGSDEEERELPQTRPAAVLVVRGGDDGVVYRGWPIRILLRSAAAAAPPVADLSVKGPAAVVPRAVPGAGGEWLISPDDSKAMATGTYTLSAGGASAEVVVADEPASLSPEQRAARRAAMAEFALAQGDAAGAEKVAREGIAEAPGSAEAHAILGDALAAAGKADEALRAYNEALALVPPDVKPPGALYGRAAALRRKMLTTVPTREAAPPAADDVAYYKIIDEGDKLLAAEKYAEAGRAYARALAFHRSKKLGVSPDEVEQKIAYARERQKAPATRPG